MPKNMEKTSLETLPKTKCWPQFWANPPNTWIFTVTVLSGMLQSYIFMLQINDTIDTFFSSRAKYKHQEIEEYNYLSCILSTILSYLLY